MVVYVNDSTRDVKCFLKFLLFSFTYSFQLPNSVKGKVSLKFYCGVKLFCSHPYFDSMCQNL